MTQENSRVLAASGTEDDESSPTETTGVAARIERTNQAIVAAYARRSQEHLEELMLTARRSRIALKAHDKQGEGQRELLQRITKLPVLTGLALGARESKLAKLALKLFADRGEARQIAAGVRAARKNEEIRTPFGVKRLRTHLEKSTKLPSDESPGYLQNYHPGKILYLLHNCRPYANGGYAIRSHGVIRGLQSWGYDVIPVARPGFPFDVDDSVTDAPPVTVDGVTYNFFPNGVAHRGEMSRGLYAEAYFQAVCELVEKHKPAVIQAASFCFNGHAALRIREKYGIPVVYELRGLALLSDMSKNNEGKSYLGGFFPRPQRFWEFREEVEVALRADHLLCITHAVADLYRKLGVPEDQLSVFPNGVSREVANLPLRPARTLSQDETIWLGYLGSIQYYEGLEELVEAVEILAQSKPDLDVRVLIVGDGTHAKQIHERIAASPAKDRFEVHGRVPHEEIDGYYERCTAMVYPRRPLPICDMISPLKPFEPMARGIPVIASDVAALAEIVRDGETGFLFEAGNGQSLADCIVRMASSPEQLDAVRDGARDYVQNERNWRLLTGPVGALYKVLRESAGKRGKGKRYSGVKPTADVVALADIEMPPALDGVQGLRPSDAARMAHAAAYITEPGSVLDVGVGYGHLLEYLQQSGKATSVTGADIRFTNAARRRLPAEALHEMSVAELGFEENQFDYVCCFEVLEHIDVLLTDQAIAHLRRVCKRDLFISMPFAEPAPLSRFHFQSFDEARLRNLFPTAHIKILSKIEARRNPWVFIHERQNVNS